jgi:phage terminase Nu1 subunit (DNA packaging protein)
MMEFNKNQIAEAFGINLTTVDKWRRSGCPAEKKGPNVMFSVRQVSDWLRTRDTETSGVLDLSQERAKLTKLQAEKATLELEVSRGNLIPMELVVETWQGHIGNARAKLLAMPAKAAAQTIGMDEYLETEQFLTGLINEALDELDNDGLPKQHVKSLEAIAEDMEVAANANG